VVSNATREWNNVSPVQQGMSPFGIARPLALFSGAIRGGVDYLYPDRSDLFTEAYRQNYNDTHSFLQQIPSHGFNNSLRAAAIEGVLTGGIGRASSAQTASRISVEAQFEANSLHLADEGHDLFMRGIQPGGFIQLRSNLSMEIQRGGFVDGYIRRGNLVLRDELGLDATAVRINQRLYSFDGKFTVPDIHFPGSGNTIDYSYALKTAQTPQIVRIQQAAPIGNVTIIPPSVVRPIYVIGN
jgi:hypothetical protein